MYGVFACFICFFFSLHLHNDRVDGYDQIGGTGVAVFYFLSYDRSQASVTMTRYLD
jgi:hypothetical protein